MNFSRFMVACALHGGDEDGGEEGPRLVLTEDEQRSLYGRVALLDRCNEALLARLPGEEMSALGALAFLVREARGSANDGGGEAERQAAGIDHGMDLRRQSASGTTHATIRTPLLEPAACWRTRTLELSIICMLQS